MYTKGEGGGRSDQPDDDDSVKFIGNLLEIYWKFVGNLLEIYWKCTQRGREREDLISSLMMTMV